MPKGKPSFGPRQHTGLKAKHPREYEAWVNMHNRCRGNGRSGVVYVARGITVCERWHTFAQFLADMGPRPPGGSRCWSLERLDNDRGYSPDNCVWATPKTQANNRSQNGHLPGPMHALAAQMRTEGKSYDEIYQVTGLARKAAREAYNRAQHRSQH